MVYMFFDKKAESTATRKVETIVNEELAQGKHKLMIKKCKTRKIYASFKDNIWAAD